MEHSLHFILISVGLIAGLIIWFWDSIRNKSLTYRGIKFKSLVLLVILLFTIFHASGGLVIAHYHQSQDSTNPHPCCMPQSVDNAPAVIIKEPQIMAEAFVDEPTAHLFPPILQINNKSPPNSKV